MKFLIIPVFLVCIPCMNLLYINNERKAHTGISGTSFSDFSVELSIIPLMPDTDGDTITDDIDLDDDNDGILDTAEGCSPTDDTDGDGLINCLDLDSDNDGIYDVVEAGHGQVHVAGRITGAVGTDGVPDAVQGVGQENSGTINYTVQNSDAVGNADYKVLDSDGDGCDDVIEAGYFDGNADGLLGPLPIVVDGNGLVTSGVDGYTVPVDGDINTVFDYREVGSTLTGFSLQPLSQNICAGSGANFSVTVTGGSVLSYQWQVSRNGGLSYKDLSNTGIYSGATTATLTISGETDIHDGEQYRVLVTNSSYLCSTITSNIATLSVQGALLAEAGPDDTFCSNASYVLAGRIFNASSITWSGSLGISDTSIANPTYTPTAAEIAAGVPVTLTLTASGIGLCSGSPIVDTVTLTIVQDVPTADAGADAEFCGNGAYNLNGTATNQSAIAWSRSTGGTTGINDPTLEDPIFTPTAADRASGTVTLVMAAYGMGGCYPLGVPGYLFRKKITVNSDQVIGASDFSDYALLVNTTDLDLRSTANGGHVENTNGYDIVFTTSDGTTLLSHQLEKYGATTGELATWVGLPTLSTTSDTVIYMYYGNPAAVVDTSTNAIWATDYQSVLHMSEDPTGVVPQMVDATPNGNSGTTSGMAAGNSVAGLMGNALTFDEVNDYVSLPDFDYTTSNAFTVSFWFRITTNTGTGYKYIYSHGIWDTTNSLNIYMGEQSTPVGFGENTLRTVFRDNNDGSNQSGFDAGTTYADSEWHLYTFSTTSSGNPKVYVDGIERSNITFYGGDPFNPNTDIFIGRRSASTANRYFGGEIDEIRILNGVQSVDLLQTEYNNQNTPNDFYHISAETDLNPITDTVILTISPEAVVDTQPMDRTVFAGSNGTFTVVASNVDTYQWQLSTDGGMNFTNISDGPEYAGTQTASLMVNNVGIDKNGYLYRVQILDSGNSCGATLSNNAVLTARVRRVITNRSITYKVNKN